MEETHKFECPHCEQRIEAKQQWAGIETNCPTCGHAFTIPALEDELDLPETPKPTKSTRNPLVVPLALVSLALIASIAITAFNLGKRVSEPQSHEKAKSEARRPVKEKDSQAETRRIAKEAKEAETRRIAKEAKARRIAKEKEARHLASQQRLLADRSIIYTQIRDIDNSLAQLRYQAQQVEVVVDQLIRQLRARDADNYKRTQMGKINAAASQLQEKRLALELHLALIQAKLDK